jgi:SNF2 family DNA or RNA helicase
MALVSTSSGQLEEIRDLTLPGPRTLMQNLPLKVEALIADLKGLPLDVKWYFPLCNPQRCSNVLIRPSIVFSTWRLTLDMVGTGLDRASIPYLRYDGKVPQKDRQSVVDMFKTDPAIRVMLLTLSCGAVGYVAVSASGGHG